jgi:CelD/BcsL family acetyltransferase involved in cellulose biosynthesis
MGSSRASVFMGKARRKEAAAFTNTSTAIGTGIPRVRLVSTLHEVEGLRERWDAAPIARFNADLDFYLAYAASQPSFVRPHVLLVERSGELEAMLVARVEDIDLSATFGYRSVFRSRVRSITLTHGGLISESDQSAHLLLNELRRSLARREADVVSLPALRTDGPLLRAATSEVPAVLREPVARPSLHRRVVLPLTGEEFLRSLSKSTRESTKRYRKKVERDLGERLQLRVYDKESDLERIFSDTDPVARKTYQRGLGVALEDTPEQRSLLQVGLRRGWFRTYVLYLEGRPIAFWPGYAYRGTFFIGTPGYDPEFGRYRIGMYLLGRMIDEFCGDPDVQAVDFGFGDAEYKRRFGSESWEECNVRLFAPTPRALALNAARTAIGASAAAATALLTRFGWLDQVKRRGRRQLQRQDGQSRASSRRHSR